VLLQIIFMWDKLYIEYFAVTYYLTADLLHNYEEDSGIEQFI